MHISNGKKRFQIISHKMIDQTIFYLALPLEIITRKLSIPDSDASRALLCVQVTFALVDLNLHESPQCQLSSPATGRHLLAAWLLHKILAEISVDRGCGKTWQNNTKYFYFIKTCLYFDLPFLDWIGLTDGYWCRPGKGNSKLLIFVTLLMLLTIC